MLYDRGWGRGALRRGRYNKGEYIFDIHPPLGKLTFVAVGWLVGYDADVCNYDYIGRVYDDRCKYVLLRYTAGAVELCLTRVRPPWDSPWPLMVAGSAVRARAAVAARDGWVRGWGKVGRAGGRRNVSAPQPAPCAWLHMCLLATVLCGGYPPPPSSPFSALPGTPPKPSPSLAAFFGTLLAPLMYLVLGELGASRLACLVGGSLVTLDMLNLIESRLVLVDSQLMLYSVGAFYVGLRMWRWASRRQGPWTAAQELGWALLLGNVCGAAIRYGAGRNGVCVVRVCCVLCLCV
jgi:hypothetical protein